MNHPSQASDDRPDQAQMFSHDLDALIERYRIEFDITYAQLVGALTIRVWRMSKESQEPSDHED